MAVNLRVLEVQFSSWRKKCLFYSVVRHCVRSSYEASYMSFIEATGSGQIKRLNAHKSY